jgi:hypothetical protein
MHVKSITTGLSSQILFSFGLALYSIANPPIRVDIPHCLSRDAVCVHDGPRAWIVFAEKDHARLRLQGSVEPCQRVRGVSLQFDLDDVIHMHSPICR